MSRKQTKTSPKRTAVPPGVIILIAGGLLLLGLVAVAIWTSVAGTGGKPSLSVDTEQIDFGDVPLGQSVTAAFTLTNTGDAPLRFSRSPYIQVAAGC
jgi:hypothetical protein